MAAAAQLPRAASLTSAGWKLRLIYDTCRPGVGKPTRAANVRSMQRSVWPPHSAAAPLVQVDAGGAAGWVARPSGRPGGIDPLHAPLSIAKIMKLKGNWTLEASLARAQGVGLCRTCVSFMTM